MCSRIDAESHLNWQPPWAMRRWQSGTPRKASESWLSVKNKNHGQLVELAAWVELMFARSLECQNGAAQLMYGRRRLIRSLFQPSTVKYSGLAAHLSR